MSAYLIVNLKPLDADKLQEYSTLAAKTLSAVGAEFVARGERTILHGASDYPALAVIRFPSREVALNWYNSDEYQALAGIRGEGMDSEFHLVGE